MVGGRKLYVGDRSFDAVINSCRIGSDCLGVVVYREGKIRFFKGRGTGAQPPPFFRPDLTARNV